MNYRPMVYVDKGWHGNALVFATREEAEANAHDLFMRWFSCSDSRADETTDPVNYRWVDNKLVAVPLSGEYTEPAKYGNT